MTEKLGKFTGHSCVGERRQVRHKALRTKETKK